MKRILFSVIAIMCILSLSCQKAQPPEGKKEVQAQQEEVKQPQEVEMKSEGQVKQQPEKAISQEPSEEKKETSLVKEPSPLTQEGQKKKKEKSPQSASQEKEVQFKEPVLLWEREFDPPLINISDQNSAGEYIAIQGGDKEGRPTKILFLDNKGKTIKEIPLAKKEKRKIPPEQVWLTYYGDQWDDEKFKKSFTKGEEIETVTNRAFVSGNGEYYGIVTQDTAIIDREYPSPWYEFAYYDKKGKLLWKMIPKDNYGFSNKAHISYDGSRVLIIDEAIKDYKGQRWYSYDEKGNLIKDEDHNLMMTIGDPEKWKKKEGEWLDEVKISQNSKYIGYTKGVGENSKAGLMDAMGRILWEKRLNKTHSRVSVTGSGNSAVTAEGTIYFVNNNGKVLSKIACGIVPISPISQSGRMLLSEGELGKSDTKGILNIYDAFTGDLILTFKIGEVPNQPEITWVDKVDLFENDRFMLISYNIKKKTDSICIFDMKEKKVIWKKENLGNILYFNISPTSQYLKLLDYPSYSYPAEIKKVIIFDLSGGKNP